MIILFNLVFNLLKQTLQSLQQAEKLLLDNPKLINYQDNRGNNLLMLLALLQEDNIIYLQEAIQLLMHHKININAINQYGNTAITIATATNNKAIIKMLLSHPNIDFNVATQGFIALNWANQYALDEIINLILHKANHNPVKNTLVMTPIDANTVDKKGNTLLTLAVKFKNISMVKLICCGQYSIDFNFAKQGQRSIYLAFKNNDVFTFKYLLHFFSQTLHIKSQHNNILSAYLISYKETKKPKTLLWHMKKSVNTINNLNIFTKAYHKVKI